ncbi:MAG: pyruvate kinase [Saprospiraceae bacterium]|nr:pyruvate kinase [Saprospiraceae bacterium]
MKPNLTSINKALIIIEKEMMAQVEKRQSYLSTLSESERKSAINLIQYLTLRSKDIRSLQNELHEKGLSSLASSESHIRHQLQEIRQRLGATYKPDELDPCSYAYSSNILAERSTSLFGTKDSNDLPHLMVTFDSGFAHNYAMIKSLLLNGMNIARINCAHDDETVWSQMVQKIKKACDKTGKSCKIYFDLAGPKIRTKLIGKGKHRKKVKVEEGQLIWLAYDMQYFNHHDIVINPTEEGLLDKIKKGDRVYFDDGIIKSIAEIILPEGVGIRISRIASEKKLIKSEKGINFPDTELGISPLTEHDLACLPFILENADLVGMSFVRNPTDISQLSTYLNDSAKGKNVNIVLKIETPEAVKNLPDLLLEGLKHKVFGIMIARGDLAVEIGFERMGEIQEEILWICESAHVPVIWATQVLENLNKAGIATRSEITDAGHAAAAECVMINKGEHTIEVIESLKDILQRTAEHRNKKRFIFRPLNIAKGFIG